MCWISYQFDFVSPTLQADTRLQHSSAQSSDHLVTPAVALSAQPISNMITVVESLNPPPWLPVECQLQFGE